MKLTTKIILIIVIVGGLWYYFFFSMPTYEHEIVPKPIKGNPDAKVKIVEFSDLQCPACRAANPVAKQIVDEYGDNISFEYKHFPLRQIHPFAQLAAEASECANDQGKFWEYVDYVFSNQQQGLQKKNLKIFAERLKLDTKSFNACLDSGAKRDLVEMDYQDGIQKNVGGSPTFFINEKELESWRYDAFKAAIDAELQKS
ncbi:MAG: DsbA family protein [Candidatus Woesearchaeota archaeon]